MSCHRATTGSDSGQEGHLNRAVSRVTAHSRNLATVISSHLCVQPTLIGLMLMFVTRVVTRQVHLQPGEVLLLVEEDPLQNQPNGPSGSQTGQQEQPRRQVAWRRRSDACQAMSRACCSGHTGAPLLGLRPDGGPRVNRDSLSHPGFLSLSLALTLKLAEASRTV